MLKRLSLATVAIALVAFASPAVSSASQVTKPAGVVLPVGSVLKAVSTNVKIATFLGTITCATVTMEAELTTNSGGTVTGKGKGTGVTSSCLLNGKTAVSVTVAKLKHFHLTSPSDGNAEVTFQVDLPAGIGCHFEDNASFTYTSGTSQLHLVGLPDGGPCDPSVISGDFNFTSGGSSVVFD